MFQLVYRSFTRYPYRYVSLRGAARRASRGRVAHELITGFTIARDGRLQGPGGQGNGGPAPRQDTGKAMPRVYE